MLRLFSLSVLLLFSISCLAYAVEDENIQDEKRDVGKILCIGSGITFYDPSAPRMEYRDDFTWLWSLHAILTDNHMKHEFVGCTRMEPALFGDVISCGGIKSATTTAVHAGARRYDLPAKYAGQTFSGEVISAPCLRLAEISGRVKGLDCLENTNISDWFGLRKKHKGKFRLRKMPDVVIVAAGLADLIDDSGYIDTKSWKLGKPSSLKKITKKALGSLSKKPSARGKADMDVIVSTIRRAVPEARILVLPILPYSDAIIFGPDAGPDRQITRNNDNLCRIRGWKPNQIQQILEDIDAFNADLKTWADVRGVEYVSLYPGVRQWLQQGSFFSGAADNSDERKQQIHNVIHFSPTSFEHRMIAHWVAASLGSAGGTDGLPRRSSKEFSRDIKKAKSSSRNLELYSVHLPDGALRQGFTMTARVSVGSGEEYTRARKEGVDWRDWCASDGNRAYNANMRFLNAGLFPCGIVLHNYPTYDVCYQGCMSDCREELRMAWEPMGMSRKGIARYWLGDKLIARVEWELPLGANNYLLVGWHNLDHPGKFLDFAYTVGAYAPPLPEQRGSTDSDGREDVAAGQGL